MPNILKDLGPMELAGIMPKKHTLLVLITSIARGDKYNLIRKSEEKIKKR